MILPGSDISVFIMDHEDRHINMGEYVCQIYMDQVILCDEFGQPLI